MEEQPTGVKPDNERSGGIDPDALTPLASLNNARIVAIPGVRLPPETLGRTAYALLSSEALAEHLRAHAPALGLADVREAEASALLRRFDRCFGDPSPSVRAAAEASSAALGQRLGALLLTLRRGDAASRAARPEWGDAYWARWAGITTIHLGGGIVAGGLGPRLAGRAAQLLHRAGLADATVRRAAWPTLLPLIGAARSAPATCRAALVLDFGQSFVKRARARYADGQLVGLDLLAPIPVRAVTAAIGNDPTAGQIQVFGEYMVAIVAKTWRESLALGPRPDPVICASIASYLHDGQPLPRRGSPYESLRTLSPRLADWLAARLQSHLDEPIAVTLLHDSSAAARAISRDPRAAVIMMGTALGIGFPDSAQPLRPLAADFAVAEHGARA